MLLRTLKTLRTLRRNVRLHKQEIRALQDSKLRALMQHAYKNVRYYRDLFDTARVSPAEIRGVSDLHRLPTTGKLTMQSLDQNDILAGGIDLQECEEDVTSGSTGIPLHVYFTKDDYEVRSLSFIRTFMEAGYRLTQRQAIVCDTRFVTEKKYWFQKMGIFRKTYIPVQLGLDRQIDLLRNSNPDFIHGYPLSIALIAEEMLKREIKSIKPRMVCTGAELVSSKTRALINAAFGVNIVDTYATIESGMIAWQCEARDGYHINADTVVLEVLRDGRPAQTGERGTAVITNLHSYAMPIIRYELGDICVLDNRTCSCGRQFPMMAVVEGRVDDMIHAPSGAVISPNSITNAMEAVEGIRQFRVIQETTKLLVVQVVGGPAFSSHTAEKTKRLLSRLTGTDMTIDLQKVDTIPKDQSGKIRAVISRIHKTSSSHDH